MIDQSDVISVALNTTSKIVDDFSVYACPATRVHRNVPYLTFRRKGGGHMEAVYRIEKVYVFSPKSPIPEATPDSHRKRLQDYIQACKSSVSFSPANAPHRFYLFAKSEKIELPHRPRPPRNQPPHWYYRLSDLKSGKEIVQVASKAADSSSWDLCHNIDSI